MASSLLILNKKRIRFKERAALLVHRFLLHGLVEITESERVHFKVYEKNPIRPGIRYFSRSMYKVIVKPARSA